MGIISFFKNAGEQLFSSRSSDDPESQARRVNEHLKSLGLDTQNVQAKVHNDQVVLDGQVNSAKERNLIVAAAGNIDGISKVDSHLTVKGSQEDVSEEVYYNVNKGDTLSKIAQKYYGDPRAYQQIFEANTPLLKDPDRIYPGQKLIIPKAEKKSSGQSGRAA